MRTGKLFLAAIAVTLLAVAAYWYWSPFLAIRNVQRAAIAHDADAFNVHVDYPRVRDSLKQQLSARMAGNARPGDAGNPLAAFGATLGRLVADKVVDAMVRPDIVMRAMRSGRFDVQPPAPDVPASTPPDQEAKSSWTWLRLDANTLLIYPQKGEAAPAQKTGIVFERSGFADWKITQLRLPAAD